MTKHLLAMQALYVNTSRVEDIQVSALSVTSKLPTSAANTRLGISATAASSAVMQTVDSELPNCQQV